MKGFFHGFIHKFYDDLDKALQFAGRCGTNHGPGNISKKPGKRDANKNRDDHGIEIKRPESTVTKRIGMQIQRQMT